MSNNQTPKNPLQRRQARQERIEQWMQWLGYPLGGLGIPATIILFKTGQPFSAIITASASIGITLLAIAAKWLSDLFNTILDKIEEKLEEKVDPLATWVVESLNDFVLRIWWRLTSKFEGKYYQQLIYDCRDYKTYGLKTKGAFIFKLEKIFVPLRVSPESLQNISPDIIKRQDGGKETTIWDFLVESKDIYQFRKIAIIGKPGSGKTTLLKDLTLTYAQNRHRRQHRQAPKLFPILIYLRDVRDMITKKDSETNQYVVNTVTLPEVIEKLKSVKKLNPPKGVFKDFLHQKDCLIMFDGLDEVADDRQRKAVSKWVNEQINEYQKARFIVTSRPFGYHVAPVDNINTILDVKLFNLIQVEKFINNWYLQREIMSRVGKDDPGVRQEAKDQADDLINRIKNNNTLASLAVNPLLLTMIATVHCYRGALPGRRVELYAEICDVLLGRRDEAKGIYINLTPEQQKVVLQKLALRLTAEKETREFSLELGSELINDKLKDVAGSKFKPNAFIENVEKRSGLLVERENNIYEFTHKSFQEYLTAVEIKESNKEDILINNINNSWWEETIRLYAAQTDATNLIDTALQNPDVTALKLALDCCDEGLSVKVQVKERLYQRIKKGLNSENKDEFELAAKVQLSRRLSKLVRIDDNLEIDRKYITCAEYQLFVNNWNWQNENIKKYPDTWNNGHFSAGDAEKPITNINWENANLFCAWLTKYFEFPDNLYYYYRLPRREEREKYPVNNDSWLADNGIRLVRFSIPSLYSKLTYLLASQQWKEADRETYQVMLEVANCTKKGYLDIEDIQNFPVNQLRTIDQLWVDYSNGHFGFSVQKQIWLDCGGKIGKYDYKVYEKLGDRVGWRKNGNWLSYSDFTFNTDALRGHLPVGWAGGVMSGLGVRWDMGFRGELPSLLSRL
ncbi:MAG: GUN4 domain-containing protein [Crocosphaera sp.]|nr:GUN4 domain-containing protein [Crocosphaera sp.]